MCPFFDHFLQICGLANLQNPLPFQKSERFLEWGDQNDQKIFKIFLIKNNQKSRPLTENDQIDHF